MFQLPIASSFKLGGNPARTRLESPTIKDTKIWTNVALFLNIQTGNLRLAVLSAWDPTTLSEIVPHLLPCTLTVHLRNQV
jgi:hypothetical protein